MSKSLKILPEKCTGCMQCELACSWVQTGAFQPSRAVIRVNIFDEEASCAPFTCFQCGEARLGRSGGGRREKLLELGLAFV